MKTESNIPLPTIPVKWKEGQWIIFANHKDNGIQPEGREGSRYTADFTIIESLTAEEAINAFNRQHNDKQLDDDIINNIEINGQEAIKIKRTYGSNLPLSIFPSLPASGFLKKGEIYSYQNGAVMVEQDHNRTIYNPEETPALFSLYRTSSEGLPWIPSEKITINSTRTFNGKTYKCIQAHTSITGQTPDLVPALWNVIATSSEWEIGVSYKVNDIVTYAGKSYKCLQLHTSQAGWTPVAVPALWKLQ